jgi:hypothetical protein
MFGCLDSHFSLAISNVKSFKFLVISSSLGSYMVGLEEAGESSHCFFSYLSYLAFNLSNARMLDSTSMVAYWMDNKVVDLHSLNRRENFASNALA